MKRRFMMFGRIIIPLFFFIFLIINNEALAKSTDNEVDLGPQSIQSLGEKRMDCTPRIGQNMLE